VPWCQWDFAGLGAAMLICGWTMRHAVVLPPWSWGWDGSSLLAVTSRTHRNNKKCLGWSHISAVEHKTTMPLVGVAEEISSIIMSSD